MSILLLLGTCRKSVDTSILDFGSHFVKKE